MKVRTTTVSHLLTGQFLPAAAVHEIKLFDSFPIQAAETV